MKAVLLANGPSLANVDFARVKLDTFGMNRSWMLEPDPRYHVALETAHYAANPAYHEKMARFSGLFVAGSGWPIGKRLAFASVTFSRDVFKEGVVTEMGGVGSVFYAALQVAYTLGYRTIYALGLDLSGPHFDGSPASPHVEKQNAMFAHIPSDLQVFTAGSPESKSCFINVDIEEVYGS